MSLDSLQDLPNDFKIQLNLRKAPALSSHNRKLKNCPTPSHGNTTGGRIHTTCSVHALGIAFQRISLSCVGQLMQIHSSNRPNTHRQSCSSSWRKTITEKNWRKLGSWSIVAERSRGVKPSEIVIHIYAYLSHPDARPTASEISTNFKVQRATAPRNAVALQRNEQAAEARQLLVPRSISGISLTPRLAPDPLLAEPEERGRTRQAQESLGGPEFKKIRIMIQGSILTLEVDVESVREALNLD